MPVKTKLPQPTYTGPLALEAAIHKRRSDRKYSDTPLTLAELSQLLWAAQGVTGGSGERTTPSAGAQYPLHVQVVAGTVTDLAVGLYEYAIGEHSLVCVSNNDLRPALGSAALDEQPWVREAAAIIVVVADFGMLGEHFQTQPPRGERGARYAYIETGALAQNVHLQATALGLSVVLVGGFDDDKVKTAVRIPPESGPTALLCIGRN